MDAETPQAGKSLFLTLEGIEGAGKSTQVELLADVMRRAGRDVVLTREPGGGGRVGETMRRLLKDPDVWRDLELSEIYLYAAARAEHVESTILPALESGRDVICDRYVDSTVAYQGYGRGRPIELIERLHRLPPLHLTPDATFLLDLPVELALARARHRSDADAPGYDDEDLQFFRRVRNGYLERARMEPKRLRVVDASTDVSSVRIRILRAAIEIVPELATVESRP